MSEDEILEEGDETVEQEALVEPEEDAFQGAEFQPEVATKPKSDVYTLILILAFVAFLTGIIIAGRELYDNYDVQFWVFSKE